MKLVKSIMTKNPCYSGGRKLANGVQGLMLHSVGCPQPKAKVFIDNWNKPTYKIACVHAFIDANDGTIYQTLPWDWRGWHCGSGSKGSGNNTHIGVEMCEPSCIKYTKGSEIECSDMKKAKAYVERTYKAAVELFAYLCEKYDLNPTKPGVIISHHEGYEMRIATGHGDPEHLWSQLKTGYTMDKFRKDVKAAMNKDKVTSSTTTTKSDKKTETTEKKSNKYPSTPFKVKVLIDDLTIRSTPNGKSTGKYTGKGTFTISSVKDDWGKLKSGLGWIYLGNTKYCKVLK